MTDEAVGYTGEEADPEGNPYIVRLKKSVGPALSQYDIRDLDVTGAETTYKMTKKDLDLVPKKSGPVPPPGYNLHPIEDSKSLPVDYAEGIDNILGQVHSKELGAHMVLEAMTKISEARGEDYPLDSKNFSRICGWLAEVQAAREVAWLYGLGPEHADRVATLMIEKLFGKATK